MKNILSWFFPKPEPLSDMVVIKLQKQISELENNIVSLSKNAYLITDSNLVKRMQRGAQDWYKEMQRTKYYLFMRFIEIGGDIYELNSDLPIPLNKVGLSEEECSYFTQKSLLENTGVKVTDSYREWKKRAVLQ